MKRLLIVLSLAVRVMDAQTVYMEHFFLPELLAANEGKNLSKTGAFLQENFSTPPLVFSDCVYFNDAMKHSSVSKGQFSLFNISGSPYSLRFYTDTTKNNIDDKKELNLYPKTVLTKYLQPFYFRKYEVTNGEYREFVKYVFDSIARRLLSVNGFEEYVLPLSDNSRSDDYYLDWKKKLNWNSKNQDYRNATIKMFLTPGNGFLNDSMWQNKRIDPVELNFASNVDSAGIPIPPFNFWSVNLRPPQDVVNIYPDTLCWVRNFHFPDCVKMTKDYFSNPVFNDFPVVGITYDQAKSFLNWKTLQEQKKLDAKGIKLRVEFDLPTEIEWEIASTSQMQNEELSTYGKNYKTLADNSWLTDLILDDSLFRNAESKNYIKSFRNYSDPLTSSDFYVFTAPANLEKIKTKSTYKFGAEKITHDNTEILKQLDDCKISFMGGNVSEWLNQNYADWRPAFLLQLKLLHSFDTPESTKEYQWEIYFNSSNSKTVWRKDPAQDRHQYDGYRRIKKNKLVRGANWFDEKYSYVFGKNPEGTNAKCFLDPEADYCTLGFRYVIRVTKK